MVVTFWCPAFPFNLASTSSCSSKDARSGGSEPDWCNAGIATLGSRHDAGLVHFSQKVNVSMVLCPAWSAKDWFALTQGRIMQL